MAYYVNLLASDRYGTLYLGVTNDVVRRVHEHRSKAVAGFTKGYSIDRLVRFEIYDDVSTAIAREKEMKKWRRAWKIRVIEEKTRTGWICIRRSPPATSDEWIPGSHLAVRPGMTACNFN
jgi:putative endonuclease